MCVGGTATIGAHAMRLKILSSIGLFLILANASCEEFVWGERSNGLRVSISSGAIEFPSDQQPRFTVRIQNATDADIWIPNPDTVVPYGPPRPEGYQSRPLKPAISLISGTDKHWSQGYGPKISALKTGTRILKAHEIIEIKEVPLVEHLVGDRNHTSREDVVQKFWWLRPQSEYRIQFLFENELAEANGQKLWTGLAASNAFTLKMLTPSPRQFEIEAGFTLPKQEYFLGEPIHATLAVTNKGKKDIAFPYGSDYRSTGRHERFHFKAIDKDGVEAKDPVEPGMMGGGLGSTHVVKSGETYREEQLASAWFTLEKPGDYTLVCTRPLNLHFADVLELQHMEELMAVYPVETKIKIQVKADLAALENMLKAGVDDKVLSSLAAGKNPTAFPYVKEALLKDDEASSEAVHWAASYGPEKAGPVLMEAWAKSKNETTRRYAFWQLQHMKLLTEEVVAKCLMDKDPWNRVAGLRALEESKYEGCMPMLIEMAGDPSPEVRREIPRTASVLPKKHALPVLQKLVAETESDIETRINAAEALREHESWDGVGVLVDLLNKEAAKPHRDKIIRALQNTTKQQINDDGEWRKWWETHKPRPPG
jgi:hypothetical protein